MARLKKQPASRPRRARGTASAPAGDGHTRDVHSLDGRKLDAFPDRIDLRDWSYQPTLAPLPEQLVNCAHVPEILNQGTEGACTGFALAAVINFLLHQRSISRRVSPRMLYELARRYDEWPGEAYEGSSARGGMKAWARHGVCARAVAGRAPRPRPLRPGRRGRSQAHAWRRLLPRGLPSGARCARRAA